MNYRHAFHAGNFADLAKHAALTLVLEAMTRSSDKLIVIDTHAGAGAYDLRGEDALKSGEAERGIARLAAVENAPEGFDMLLAAVARHNPSGQLEVYPGSPALTAAALRPQDKLIAFELATGPHSALNELLFPLKPQAEAVKADGFTGAATRVGREPTLVLIDPPFEARDDYTRIVKTCSAILSRNSRASILVWLPLKDLETFDGFLRDLEDIRPPATLVAETRLRPLHDPMTMNGCALVLINPPAGLQGPLAEICGWIAKNLGDQGGEGRVWNL
jgi:23S rRNA (adenine2030-N6)-methyltransferase